MLKYFSKNPLELCRKRLRTGNQIRYKGVKMPRNQGCCNKDPFTGIAGAVGGTLLVMVLFVVLFARDQTWVLAPIASAMAIIGNCAWVLCKPVYEKHDQKQGKKQSQKQIQKKEMIFFFFR
jgi:hypothetical protein